MSVAYEAPHIAEHDDDEPYLRPVASPPPTRPPRRPRRRRRAWLAALGLSAVVVLGVAAESVPPGTPGHPLLTTIVGAPQVAAAAPSAENPPPTSPNASHGDPQVAAIQQVIQQSNAEQVQAIATQNPSVMSDTATAAHLQQMTQINQQLLAQGVTAIQLTNLSWGPITVNGNSATATTSETWVTTFSDSTTMSSTDTNVYTLTLQNGNWVIADDQQPNSASSTTAPGPGVAPTAPQAGSVPQPQTTTPGGAAPNNISRNWSGYVATGQTYTAVTGTWTVPQPSSSGAGSAGVGATWVGIGGVNSRDLIQAGTQDVSSGGGQSQFQAWIETLPQPSQQVPLAVSPGDSVTLAITEQSTGSGVWNISFKNNTSGQTYQTTLHYASTQSSAEWIEEAPASGNGIVPLDNFGSVPFSAATAVANGQTVDLTQAGAQPITMLNATGQALAVPSSIGSDGSSFNVARTSASATPVPTGRRGFAAGG